MNGQLWDNMRRASDKWRRELQRSGIAPFTDKAAGKAGTRLRTLHDEAMATCAEWQKAHNAKFRETP